SHPAEATGPELEAEDHPVEHPPTIYPIGLLRWIASRRCLHIGDMSEGLKCLFQPLRAHHIGRGSAQSAHQQVEGSLDLRTHVRRIPEGRRGEERACDVAEITAGTEKDRRQRIHELYRWFVPDEALRQLPRDMPRCRGMSRQEPQDR